MIINMIVKTYPIIGLGYQMAVCIVLTVCAVLIQKIGQLRAWAWKYAPMVGGKLNNNNKIIIAATALVLFALSYTTKVLIKINYGVRQDKEQAARTTDTLNWLAHKYAGERDIVDRMAKIIDLLQFRARATELMHPEWIGILNSVWKSSREYGIPENLVLAVIHRESMFRSNARSSVAYGLMQIHYAVWREELGLEEQRLWEIEYNIDKGCKILRIYYDECGDWGTALLRYNNGYVIRNFKYTDRVMSSKFMGAK